MQKQIQQSQILDNEDEWGPSRKRVPYAPSVDDVHAWQIQPAHIKLTQRAQHQETIAFESDGL